MAKIDYEVLKNTIWLDIMGFSILIMLVVSPELESQFGIIFLTSMLLFIVSDLIKIFIVENRKLCKVIKGEINK